MDHSAAVCAPARAQSHESTCCASTIGGELAEVHRSAALRASHSFRSFRKGKEKKQQPNLEEQGEACANDMSPPSTPSATNCHTCMCLMLRCKMHLCTFDGRAIVTGLVSVRRGPDVCAPRSHTAARASWRRCPRTPGRDEVWGTSDSCLLNRPLHAHARACKRGSVMGG